MRGVRRTRRRELVNEQRPAPTLLFVCGTGTYALVLVVLGFWSAGFGHGLLFPLRIFFAPLSGVFSLVDDAALAVGVLVVCALAWPFLMILLRILRPQRRRAVGRRILLVHYASAVGLVVIGALSGQENTQAFSVQPLLAFALLSVAVYAIGQVVIWRAVGRL